MAAMIPMIPIVSILFILFHYVPVTGRSNDFNNTDISYRPDVFWINLDVSVERKKFMTRQLQMLGYGDINYRIEATKKKHILLPRQLHQPHTCMRISEDIMQVQ